MALSERYALATADLAVRGADAVGTNFQETVERESSAVLCLSLGELERLASSDRELFRRHHQLIAVEARLPSGSQWDILRPVAEEALFPGYKEKINFAALTLTTEGLPSYGECAVTLRTDRIEYRASVYEANNVVENVFTKGLKMAAAIDMPQGFRAPWSSRARLALVKCSSQLTASTKATEYPAILLTPGSTTATDAFIEVHVFGPMTIRTVASVRIMGAPRRGSQVRYRVLDRALAVMGVELKE